MKPDAEKNFQTTLLDIPWHDVLFTHIFPKLNLKEIFRLRQVSSELKLAVTEYFKLNKTVELSSMNSVFNSKAFTLLTSEASCIRRLILSNCKWLTNSCLRPVLEKNKNLVELDISGCSSVTNECLLVLAENAKFLQRLCLKNCHWVSASAVISIAFHCQYLENVDLASCWEVNDEAVCQLVSHGSSLKNLSIARIYGITDRSLSMVAEMCPKLEELNVAGCWRITDWGVRMIGEYCRNMRYLKVDDCRDVTEKSLATLRLRMRIDRNKSHYPYPVAIPSSLLRIQL